MSNKLVANLIKGFSWLLLGVSAILLIFVFTDPLLGDETRPLLERAPRSEILMFWAYFLFALACFFAALFPLIGVVKNPKGALKILAIVAAMAAIAGISYSMADTTPIMGTSSTPNPDFSNPSVLSLSDMGLFTTYVLFGVAIASVIFSSVKGLFTK
ncbi:MAG: hypothetical protein IJU72_02225 [Bacteroidales bacterium]|nr:hypothetical protein [Bacteroidales bacterium]